MRENHKREDQAELRVSWRWVSIISTCLLLAVASALIVVASISDAEILGTVALVLAVIAFVGQLLIFVAQLAFATNQLQQAERVNAETSKMLAEVSSRVTRLDETQNQQFLEIREQILPRALYPADYGERLLETLDRSVDQVAYSDPGLADQLEEELSPVREAIHSNIHKEKSTERVSCPLCYSGGTLVEIGTTAGESAHASCVTCGKSFHAHREKDKTVRTVAPGGAGLDVPSSGPEYLLRRSQMEMPDKGDRLRILSTILAEWKAGRIRVGRDVTGWMDRPSRVRTPLFFAMVNREYGPLKLDDNEDPLGGRTVVQPPTDLVDEEWLERARSAWLAQALYRLTAWPRIESQELDFFFGEGLADEDKEILKQARAWDREQKSLEDLEPQEKV